jgi:hypothetical protein
MVERESQSELEVRVHLERILGLTLQRVVPDDQPSADYTFVLGADSVAAVEVKEIASPDLLRLSAGHDKYETERATDALNLHWMIALDGETAAERLAPVPNFPDDDEAQIEAWEAAGFSTTRKAERIAEFKRRRDESPAPINIKGMIDDLIPDLKRLEDRGITSTRGQIPSDEEGLLAWRRIAGRTRGAICMGSEARPDVGLPAGIFMNLAYGYVRTGRADSIADRIVAWLESDKSANLIKSLGRSEYAERHAALVFNSLEPEWWSSAEAEIFVPTRAIELPSGVEVLWAVLGPRVLRYSASDGWQEFIDLDGADDVAG